jgi:hypothetical protein
MIIYNKNNGNAILGKRAMSTLMENVMYLIILGVFLAMISLFLWSRANSAYIWEDFYAKELSRIVSAGSSGDVYRLDVQKATTIAKRNGLNIKEASTLFIFNAQKNEVCVKLSNGEGKCHPYLSSLAVTEEKIELAAPTNFLSFELKSKEEDNE